MKKKLLSLVLAGAMVASTSVSAFADTAASTIYEATGGTNYDVTYGEKEANIKIEGNIADTRNEVRPSTISVTVPTTAKFTVDNKGNLIGSNINITSQGDTEVKVIAHKFVDTSRTADINAVDLNTLTGESADRKKVYLKLEGDNNAVSLQSDNGSGICELTTTNEIEEDEDKVLGVVNNGKNLQLTLSGSAVKQGSPLSEAVSDKFTLVLKLKKA